ncbi:beta-lactamase family protein [Nocardioides sp. cx-169]|uniref:serine hydrolase domain-containing protein n=1 Tax=Nocardioides sp. cx-169 TaxID=2899080 RepID=UPI001E4ED3EA|nr:serine hydrolase domain-containing protein [Nocardioides sp. cx-169]MCD4535382.1 beta-lactamase family protein [Nocardioides sp. cx-169]
MSADRQARLAAVQAAGRLPTVVAGVLREGELAWTGTVGGSLADRYRIGSVTKTLTAVAVLQLRDEGLLSLDDPIGAVIPETGYAAATVRELLAHTSGMQSEPVGSWWERSPGVDFATLVAANDGSGAVLPPGEFHYSNLGYGLLGEAVARLRGEPWWDVVSQRVLAPLGMTDTTYADEVPAAQGWSVDHFAGTLTPEPHHDTVAMAPAGQLWSTVADLAALGAFLAAGHPDVLAPVTLREMAEPTSQTYGLGLWLADQDGRRWVGHPGSMPGFQAGLFVDPATGDGVVALSSSTTGLDARRLPHLLLGEDPLPDAARWVPSRAVPDVVGELLGLWFWGNSAQELRWHNDTLHLRSLAAGELTDVFEVRDDRIVGVAGYHRGETVEVVRRPDGSVCHLVCATFVYTRTPYDPQAPIPGARSG